MCEWVSSHITFCPAGKVSSTYRFVQWKLSRYVDGGRGYIATPQRECIMVYTQPIQYWPTQTASLWAAARQWPFWLLLLCCWHRWVCLWLMETTAGNTGQVSVVYTAKIIVFVSNSKWWNMIFLLTKPLRYVCAYCHRFLGLELWGEPIVSLSPPHFHHHCLWMSACNTIPSTLSPGIGVITACHAHHWGLLWLPPTQTWANAAYWSLATGTGGVHNSILYNIKHFMVQCYT